jgi:predicted transcriptional regulator
MTSAPFAAIRADLEKGNQPSVPVRELLRWFGAKRRGSYIVEKVRQALKEAKLATVPDFEYEYIDSIVYFVSREQGTAISTPPSQPATQTSNGSHENAEARAVSIEALPRQDPAYRVKRLQAANRQPVSITPDKPLAEAITIMLAHDFSQVPVMQGDRKVFGIVSWKSIGSRLAMGCACKAVSEAMEAVTTVSSDASIFQVADLISKREVVLVQASTTDPKITGILTSADLADQFVQLGEPFLLLGEIENHLRELLDGKYDQSELRAVGNPSDSSRIIEHVSDLTFGEYVRLLEKPERWEKCLKSLDRGVFIEQLKKVRDIRNDVMHFDPDPISEDDIQQLRRFATFLQKLLRLAGRSS